MLTQENRPISITTPLGEDVLLFHGMHGHDALSELFEYQVNLLTTERNLSFDQLIGKPVSVAMKLQGGGEREFNGIVTALSFTGVTGEFMHYQATVHPWLWLLTRNSDCRIFQGETVLDILTKIFHKDIYGGHAVFDDTLVSKGYPALEYCVQYRETDFDFISRLLAHAGIYYFFRHEKGQHTMVLLDASRAHEPVDGYETIPFATDATRDRYGDERITSWKVSGQIQATGFEMNDFNFETALNCTNGILRVKDSIPAAYNQPAYQQYDYPGGYRERDNGLRLAQARIESLHGQSEQVSGSSNARGLTAGTWFSMSDHPINNLNRKYLVTFTEYRLFADDYTSGAGVQPRKVFECRLGALGAQYQYRPQTKARKQIIQGPQTAIVVGKAGEEIWTDKYGRVKVQFHWDREGQRNENSSCWVRVQHSAAGRRWGALGVPRIGMEVVVEFLEGDPDQPLITGCVYNSDTMPPYELPQHQSRTTLKTNSIKGGAGFNELRFEDKAGEEEIFVQAQKDHNRVVKHNDTLQVGFQHKEPGSQKVEIKHNQVLDIGNHQEVHIIKNQTILVDGKHELTIGHTSKVEAKQSIELKVGGSSILIEPAKITIKGTMIALEAGALMKIQGHPVKIN